MLFLMLACAAGAVLLIVTGAFAELSDLWSHPDHKISDEDEAWSKRNSR